MKRFFTILIGIGTLLAVQLAFGPGNAVYAQAEELTPLEAADLAYMWEMEKYLRDIYLTGTGCSDNPEVASAAIAEQEHMDSLKGLLFHYGMEVPVPGEDVGAFTESFLSSLRVGELTWTGYDWSCLNPDWTIFYMAIVYEDFAIWNLLQVIDRTGNEQLLDAYHHLLAESCDHLQLFVSLHTLVDWEGLFLSADVVEQILAGTFVPTSDDGFTINAGLNDAWYYPETAGQGFFISVFPDLGSVFLAWFTYDTELPGENTTASLGDPGHRWLVAYGPFEGSRATLSVISVSGGLFDTSPPEPIEEVIGTAILQFEDCNAGSVTYDLPAISRSGVIPIERLAIDNVPACEAHGQLQDGTP